MQNNQTYMQILFDFFRIYCSQKFFITIFEVYLSREMTEGETSITLGHKSVNQSVVERQSGLRVHL